jgi:3-oxoacyl-[acyl-carrier-protein] synthase II
MVIGVYMLKRRVVITGLGAVSPIGNTVVQNWNNAVNGVSGINNITHFDASEFSSKIAGEVKNFDPAPFLDPKEIRKFDRFVHLGVAACHEAMIDSGISNKLPYDPSRVGCILGVGIGGLAFFEKNHEAYLNGGPRKISPFLIPGMITNMAPGVIAIKNGLQGVNFTIQSACTSSTHAIGESYRMIASGNQDMIISGGTEAAVTPVGMGGFCALKALSTRNDQPTKASRPFDKDRDGFVMGEGGVILVLESYEGAKARGARIYAEILGYGYSCDAFHITAPSTDGFGAVKSMENALIDAGLKVEKIDYLNAHGTSTPANDSTETGAIKTVFGEWSTKGLLVSSTKSVTGHLLGAAGAIEALFCVLAIRDNVAPPTINLDNPDEGCDLDYVPNQSRDKKINVTMSNSFGFGGTNGTLIIGKCE